MRSAAQSGPTSDSENFLIVASRNNSTPKWNQFLNTLHFMARYVWNIWVFVPPISSNVGEARGFYHPHFLNKIMGGQAIRIYQNMG